MMAQNKNREMAGPHGEDTTRTLYPHFERRRTSSGGRLIKDCMVVGELIDENIKEEALTFYDLTNCGTMVVFVWQIVVKKVFASASLLALCCGCFGPSKLASCPLPFARIALECQVERMARRLGTSDCG